MMNEQKFQEWAEQFVKTAFDAPVMGESDNVKPGGENYQVGLLPIWIPDRSCRPIRSH